MIDITSFEDGVVRITITEKLQQGDFASITPVIDSLIEMKGNLKLLVDATQFDGWENKQAAEEHFAFVKTHHQKVDRIALITGHLWQEWIAISANVFVHPEIKTFDSDELEQAEAWLDEK